MGVFTQIPALSKSDITAVFISVILSMSIDANKLVHLLEISMSPDKYHKYCYVREYLSVFIVVMIVNQKQQSLIEISKITLKICLSLHMII